MLKDKVYEISPIEALKLRIVYQDVYISARHNKRQLPFRVKNRLDQDDFSH